MRKMNLRSRGSRYSRKCLFVSNQSGVHKQRLPRVNIAFHGQLLCERHGESTYRNILVKGGFMVYIIGLVSRHDK